MLFSGPSPQDNPVASRTRREKEEENAIIVKDVSVNIKAIPSDKVDLLLD